jgi:hypothetical protein
VVTSLKKAEAISNIAHVLYDFLPGSGRPDWKGHISFKSIAQRLGFRKEAKSLRYDRFFI